MRSHTIVMDLIKLPEFRFHWYGVNRGWCANGNNGRWR